MCVYTTDMFSVDGESSDAIEGLLRAVTAVAEEGMPETPAALRDQLVRLRQGCDRLEVQFALLASAFAATPEHEWQGCVSPIQWLRLECGMAAAAAWKAVCVGEQAEVLPESLDAVASGTLAHPLARFRDDCAQIRHAHDAAAFLAEQAQDAEYRSLEVRTGEDRSSFLNGWFDPVGGATIRAALDPLARRDGER